MNLTATALTTNTSVAAQQTFTQSKSISSDFETFLKMLTTQARYQDPLEPIDSSEYSAQLAQFSMVEQQVKSNDLLTALSTQLGAGGISQVASWIGMDARTDAPSYFSGTPISILIEPNVTADRHEVLVYDASNREIQRVSLNGSAGALEWAGVSSDGTPFPAGRYRFEVESLTEENVISTSAAETYARVVEARQTPAGPILILDGGAEVRPDQILALREPS